LAYVGLIDDGSIHRLLTVIDHGDDVVPGSS